MPRRKSKKVLKGLNEWKAKQQIKDRVDKQELHIRGEKPADDQELEVRGEDLAKEQVLEMIRGNYTCGTQQMGPPLEKQSLVGDKPHLEEADKSGPSKPHKITSLKKRSRS
ncbi:uncharacterized protein [Branchiostoma lanceolatum]|uniref:uncharacterized protein isoform X1 n=1 Tax=Branchiostoma lanceolatum TaxID=7740 RepID=UPI0034525FFA